MEMSPGEGSVLGAVMGVVVGWFSNLLYMKDKFVSTKQCENCKQSSATTETILVKGLETRVQSLESCVGDLYKQSKDNHGLIKEMHGWLRGSGKLDVL
jgi:hypothetical protein